MSQHDGDNKAANALYNLTQNELDEMVHEAKAEEAANINNEGRDAQIEYLLGVE